MVDVSGLWKSSSPHNPFREYNVKTVYLINRITNGQPSGLLCQQTAVLSIIFFNLDDVMKYSFGWWAKYPTFDDTFKCVGHNGTAEVHTWETVLLKFHSL